MLRINHSCLYFLLICELTKIYFQNLIFKYASLAAVSFFEFTAHYFLKMSPAEDLIKLIKIVDGTVSRIAGLNLLSKECNTQIPLLLSECCEIREKLRSAITLAGAMSETNIQCMLHILALKQDRAKADEIHKIEIQVLYSLNVLFVLANQYVCQCMYPFFRHFKEELIL